MTLLKSLAPLAARLSIGALFLGGGIGKLADVPGFAGYIASGGLPGMLAWPAIIFEIALGAGIILGFQTRRLALVGAAFCVATALLYHLDIGSYTQTVQLLKNFAIAGGFLMLAAHGPGRFAISR
jgi:putative oxidoreductase